MRKRTCGARPLRSIFRQGGMELVVQQGDGAGLSSNPMSQGEFPMEPVFREATADDAGPIALLAHVAGQGHARISTYDLIVPGPPGPTAQRIYLIKRIVSAQTVSMLHYSHHRVALVDGRVAACAGALSSGDASMFAFITALQETGWNEGEISLMRSGVAIYSRVEPPVPPNSWAIENIAVLPEYRRLGLASRLLELALGEGRRAGHRSVQLAIHIGNKAALALYQKHGFEVVAERRDPEFDVLFGCPGMWEMTRPL